MDRHELVEMFEKHNEDFLKFIPVTGGPTRPDLAAFLLLDKLMPSDEDIVSAAEHDKIWLSIDLDELALVITEEQVIYLVRAGISCDGDGLWSFV